MKLLFFGERVNIDLFRGESVNLRRLSEGLAEKGDEVFFIGHGHSNKMKVFSPMPFWFYTKAFTFPLTSFFSFEKFVFLIKKEKFNAVILKLDPIAGNGFWFNLKPLIESTFYLKITEELKKRKIPYFVFIEGITEKNNFISSFMGATKEIHLKVLKESNGIISLSPVQNKLLDLMGVKKPMAFSPSPVDSNKFTPKKTKIKTGLNLDKNKINLVYVSGLVDLQDFNSFFPFLENNNCVLYIISSKGILSDEFIKEITKRNLKEKIVFLGKFSHKELVESLPFFDGGVYLKKFNAVFADASYMMKISEYLSSGLPVLVPLMDGPLSQAGKAGINFEKTKKISKQELNNLSGIARNIALEKLDLEKNINLLEKFIKNSVIK